MLGQKEKRGFESIWAEWKKHLTNMATAKGARLLCPAPSEIDFSESDNVCTAKPKWPICFINVPHKGNSGSNSKKLVVFINGSFTFKSQDGIGNDPMLVSVESNVTFFKPVVRAESESIELSLLDAYHFDHFIEDPKTSAPHPVFHAQRAVRANDLFTKFQESLGSVAGNRMVIEQLDQEKKNKLFALKTFRLPTPQLDLFSLSAVIAADHLVDNCKFDSKEYASFHRFLSFMERSKPIAVDHQPNIKASAATAENRFVWQWYARH